MKRCPNCSTEYDDKISFCTKDGRALVTANTSRARLCPHCANSIEENAVRCPYCKADLGTSPERPQWPSRDEIAGQSTRRAGKRAAGSLTKPVIALVAARLMVVLSVGAFF